jgi:hypothetical protein
MHGVGIGNPAPHSAGWQLTDRRRSRSTVCPGKLPLIVAVSISLTVFFGGFKSKRIRASSAARRILMSASVHMRRAADAKMTVFVRTSVSVWGLLQRGDAFIFFLFFALLQLNIVPNITYLKHDFTQTNT